MDAKISKHKGLVNEMIIEVEWEDGTEAWIRFTQDHDGEYFCEEFIDLKTHNQRVQELVSTIRELRMQLATNTKDREVE